MRQPTGFVLAAAWLAFTSLAHADPPDVLWPDWDHTKQLARDHVYFDRKVTFYCACAYEPRGDAGGADIDAADCGFTPRSDPTRAGRLEWEHVVPASRMAGHLPCWTTGHALCSDAGRDCCERVGVDDDARRRIFDLHNLVPSIGEVNGNRSNFPYGEVAGEERVYGACNFEIGGTPRLAEPRPAIRGNIARIWFYMADTYGLTLTPERRTMFEAWDAADPVSEWEIERDRRIQELQGNRNPHVR